MSPEKGYPRVSAPEFYVRFFLMIVWMGLSFFGGFVYALFRWGNDKVNRQVASTYGKGILKLCKMKLEVENLEQLEAHQPCIYVINHQGAMDIATCGAIYPHRCVVIGKKEIVWVPFMGIFFLAAGNIPINRQKHKSAVQSLGAAVKAVRERGLSVWIFPEGTRNRTSDPMLPFKKGAFHLAIEAQAPLVPIVFGPIDPHFNAKERRLSGGILRAKVLPPIETRGLSTQDVDALIARTRGQMLETFAELKLSGPSR
jgi:lysophosphatidate acyltransferase